MQLLLLGVAGLLAVEALPFLPHKLPCPCMRGRGGGYNPYVHPGHIALPPEAPTPPCSCAHKPPPCACGLPPHRCTCATHPHLLHYGALPLYQPGLRDAKLRTLADEGPTELYGEEQAPDGAAAADAVSVALALGLKQQQLQAVREDAIAFGPKQLPRDGLVKKLPKNIPEEELLAFKKEIVELKIPQCAPCAKAALEAEAQEALLLAEEEALDSDGPPCPTISYADLGYGPAEPNDPAFVQELGCAGIPDAPPPIAGPSYAIQMPGLPDLAQVAAQVAAHAVAAQAAAAPPAPPCPGADDDGAPDLAIDHCLLPPPPPSLPPPSPPLLHNHLRLPCPGMY